MKLIPFLLLLSCATPTTICGLSAYGSALYARPGMFTLEVLQEAEDATLPALQAYATDPRFASQLDMCASLKGWQVAHEWEQNFVSYGRKVSGVTMCNLKTAIVGTPPNGDWRSSALAHELVHILQNCKARLPNEDDNDEDHANWDKDGIQRAIDRVDSP